MQITEVKGGHEVLKATITAILAGPAPNISQVIESGKGHWLILHSA